MQAENSNAVIRKAVFRTLCCQDATNPELPKKWRKYALTFLLAHRRILTVRQRTRAPIAQAGQVVFIAAEVLRFRSAQNL